MNTKPATKLGTLEATTAGGDVCHDESGYYYRVSGWTIIDRGDEEDEVHYENESERFPSLQALLASLPKGVHFQPAGVIETPEELGRRIRKQFENDDTSERLEEIDNKRMREYGTTDFLEIQEIIKKRAQKEGNVS